jgi:hypothetical protein
MRSFKPLLAVALFGLAVAAAAQVYDLQKEFSIRQNPSGPWTYGYSKTVTGFEPFRSNSKVPEFYENRGQQGLVGWSQPDAVFPFVAVNDGATTLYQRWRPGDVILHPAVGLFSIARWTNPYKGAAPIKMYITFRRVEDVTPNEPSWYVVANGKIFDQGTLKMGNEERSVTESIDVKPGESVAIVVGCDKNSDGTDLNVSASIHPRKR